MADGYQEVVMMQNQKARRLRMLIVDEELIVRKTLESFLNDLGHEVETFATISELLSASAGKPKAGVQVILLDPGSARLRGEAGIREIHERYPEADLVVMSGHNSILPLSEALAQGVYAYLSKPIRLGELELLLIRWSESRGYLKSRAETTED